MQYSNETQKLTMNQTTAASRSPIHLQSITDALVNEAASDMPLNSVGEKARKRRVRFASSIANVVGRVLSRDDFSEDEKADYWIERQEFVRIQSNAKVVVLAVKKHGPAYVDFIEDSYKIAQHLSEFMVEDDDIDLFFEDPSYYTEKMEMWSDAEYGQRGLERYISPLQKSQRSLETRETRLMVLETANKGIGNDDLAEIYAALSWMTCLYSRMLGHADYTVAYSEENLLEQPLPAHISDVKNEHDSESCFQSLKVQDTPTSLTNIASPSQDILVSRAA
jgi:hypothetical protein